MLCVVAGHNPACLPSNGGMFQSCWSQFSGVSLSVDVDYSG